MPGCLEGKEDIVNCFCLTKRMQLTRLAFSLSWDNIQLPGPATRSKFRNERKKSMIPRFVAFSLLAMLAFTAGHASGQDEKKFAELDGTWTIIKMEIEGRSLLETRQQARFAARLQAREQMSAAGAAKGDRLRASRFAKDGAIEKRRRISVMSFCGV